MEQVNALAPSRDKTSDGWIGDAAHASRASDHNPWVRDGKVGIVTAQDIDEDLNLSGKTLMAIVDAICASRDKRVKYIIYEGRITVKGTNLQQWKKYTGSNAHKHHAHISVFPDKNLYDSVADWDIDAIPATPNPVDETNYIVARGDTLWGLSRKFATSVNELKRLNGLVSDVLQIGQQLRVH